MTCVVGIVDGQDVILGADSAGANERWDLCLRRAPKVFRVGDLVIGGTTSFRMLQILEHGLTVEKIHPDEDPLRWLVKTFVPAVRSAFKEGGFAKVEHGQEEGGHFLVGLRGRLFDIQGDFQVGENLVPFWAVGCGASYAIGAMHASSALSALGRAHAGLEAAANFSAGVRGPFNFVRSTAWATGPFTGGADGAILDGTRLIPPQP